MVSEKRWWIKVRKEDKCHGKTALPLKNPANLYLQKYLSGGSTAIFYFRIYFFVINS